MTREGRVEELSLCTKTVPCRNMGSMEAELHAFWTLTRDEGKWETSQLYTDTPGTLSTRGQVAYKTVQNVLIVTTIAASVLGPISLKSVTLLSTASRVTQGMYLAAVYVWKDIIWCHTYLHLLEDDLSLVIPHYSDTHWWWPSDSDGQWLGWKRTRWWIGLQDTHEQKQRCNNLLACMLFGVDIVRSAMEVSLIDTWRKIRNFQTYI
jgi:hypothetical protein